MFRSSRLAVLLNSSIECFTFEQVERWSFREIPNFEGYDRKRTFDSLVVDRYSGSRVRYRESTLRFLDNEEEEEGERTKRSQFPRIGIDRYLSLFAILWFSFTHPREKERERGGRGRERERPGDSCVFVKISGAFPSIFVGTPELPGRGGNWRAASDELKRRSNEPNEPERPIRATRNRETTRTLTPLFSTRQNKRTLQDRLSCYAVRLTKRVNSRWSVYR